MQGSVLSYTHFKSVLPGQKKEMENSYLRISMHRSLFIISLLLFQYSAIGQMSIRGKVYHKGKGVKGASISAGSNQTLFSPVSSDESGAFEIKSHEKVDQVLIQKKGYIPKTVAVIHNKPIVVILEKAPAKKRRFLRIRPLRRPGGCPPENPLCRCCFVKGTKVLLNDGTEKNIEKIKAGDIILNVNLNNLSVVTDTVFALDSAVHNRLIEVELENKTVITSTQDHPYYIEGKGWCSYDPQSTEWSYQIPCMQLTPGDSCIFFTGDSLKPLVIKTIRLAQRKEITYNIRAKHKTYFVNGILVSTEEP